MKIYFDVKNQIITRTDRNQVIANSADYLEAEITFSAEWATMEKTMTFKNGNLLYTYVLVNNKILEENHLNLGVGTWKVSIQGVYEDKKIVTNECNLAVNASGWIGSEALPPESIWNQLLVIIQSLHTEVASTAALRSAVQKYIEDNYDALVKEAVIVDDVRAALDDMAEDGTLSDLLAPLVAAGMPEVVADQISAVVAAQIGGVVANQIGAVVASQITTPVNQAVKNYCDDNFSGWSGALDRGLTQPLMAAPADMVGEIKSALSDLDKELVDRKIILETLKPTFVTRGGIDSSGVITSGTTNYDVLYFDVRGYSKVALYAVGGYLYATYANVPQVGSQATDSERHAGDSNAISIGTGVNYIAVRCAHETIPSGYNAEQGLLVNEQMDKMQYDFDSITKSANFPVQTIKHENAYVDINNNETANNAWDYYTLTCEQYEKYTIDTMAYGNVRHWMILNENSQVIKVAANVPSLTQIEETIEIPYGGKTLLMNSNDSGTFSVVQVKTVVDEEYVLVNGEPIEDVIEGIANGAGNILYGKVLCCAGDSITFGDDMDAGGFDPTSAVTFYQWEGDYHAQYDGEWVQKTENVRKTWGYDIAKRNGMTFYNGGVNGSTMQGLDNKYGFSLANGRYTKLPDSLDYLLIWFGWNDNSYGTLGTINDATNESYYGGFNVVMPYLINKYPHAKIGLIVPYGASAGHREAVRLLANKWGVACWDNYQGGTPLYYGKEDSVGVDADIVTANRATFQAVGAHPNHYGHEYLSTMIENFLRSM